MKLRDQNCCFCTGLLRHESTAPWDTVISEIGGFVTVPSKGALLPGWLLVVAKQHALCSGALSANELDELGVAIGAAKVLVRQNFGPATIFEHGPSEPGTSLGCGVDHMHFHAVPLGFSLVGAVNQMLFDVRWETTPHISHLKSLHQSRTAYAVVQEPDGPLLWCRPPKGLGQMFRRAVANELGIPGRYDYSAYPNFPNVIETIQRLTPGWS